jgi:Bacterial PH domain
MSHRHTAPGQHEHEFEPEHGLPERLPAGERILWQVQPHWRDLAVRAFHVRKLSLYFSVILLLRGMNGWVDGEPVAVIARGLALLGLLAVFTIGLLTAMAWLAARTTAYTVTDKRVVMRIGIVLSLSLNLPLARIVAADLRRDKRGGSTGDLVLRLGPDEKIAYLHLWPHARPWRLARPEPMLRSLADAPRLAAVLAKAWADATGTALPSQVTMPPPDVQPTAPRGERQPAGEPGTAWAAS